MPYEEIGRPGQGIVVLKRGCKTTHLHDLRTMMHLFPPDKSFSYQCGR